LGQELGFFEGLVALLFPLGLKRLELLQVPVESAVDAL